MSTMKQSFRFAAACFALAMVLGCESTDGGGSSSSVGVYYGVGFYDPWYYGDYDHNHDIVVTPPANRPDGGARPGAHPEQPIAPPPSASSRSSTLSSRPAARPTPSIPSTPRPSFRGGGGGGGGGGRR